MNSLLNNYLKVALRNLKRNPGYTGLNVGGLAIGMVCTLLILLFVNNELRYDRFHERAGSIYRVQVNEDQVVTPTVVAPLFARSIAEVEAAARLYNIGGFQPPIVRYGDQQFYESGFFFADSTVFDVLTFPFIQGEAKRALSRPNTIVLTESIAKKYFGNVSPIGELLEVGGRSQTYEVTGVIADVPGTSHVQFDFLASFSSTRWAEREIWNSANFYTYVLLLPDASLPAVEAKIDQLVAGAKADNFVQEGYRLWMQPLLGIHLDFEGRRRYVYLLTSIALLILLIACINYVNLATARGIQRAREVGVRKVSGARRAQLIAQFLGESALITLLAMASAFLIFKLALPLFNSAIGQELSVDFGKDTWFWFSLAGLGMLVSLVGGAYPALLLSSYRPIQILRKVSRSGTGRSGLRRILVVFQFSVSVVLLVGTAVVYKQLGYMRTKDLGFDKDKLLVIPIGLGNEIQNVYPAFRGALLQEPAVEEVAGINRVPGYQESGYGFWAEGAFEDEMSLPPIGGVPSDEYVVETLGLRLVAGAGFISRPADSLVSGNYQYLLNEAAVRAAGWSIEEAVGKRVALSSNRRGSVVGVIADYHYLSLREVIEPLAYFLEPSGNNYMLVRLAPGPIAPAIARLETVWREWLPERPFSYTFLDEQLNLLYRAEQQAGHVFLMAALLAVLIGCLGLFGLAAFMATRRTKEVGIRKAMGASVFQVVLLLTKEFSWLVIAAFGLATPIAFLLMRQWLQGFAYKVPLSWEVFLGAGLSVLLIAWLTVSYQAIRAAQTNPVEALRYE